MAVFDFVGYATNSLSIATLLTPKLRLNTGLGLEQHLRLFTVSAVVFLFLIGIEGRHVDSHILVSDATAIKGEHVGIR